MTNIMNPFPSVCFGITCVQMHSGRIPGSKKRARDSSASAVVDALRGGQCKCGFERGFYILIAFFPSTLVCNTALALTGIPYMR
eukprot:6229798-Amphidinium_carterae.1